MPTFLFSVVRKMDWENINATVSDLNDYHDLVKELLPFHHSMGRRLVCVLVTAFLEFRFPGVWNIYEHYWKESENMTS